MKTCALKTSSLLRSLSLAAGALVISIGAAQAADYPTTILGDDPSAYYRFEELSGSTAYDSSTNGVNAGISENGEQDSPVLGEAGIDTHSFLFIGPGPGENGESDYGYVDIPGSSLITPTVTVGTNTVSAPFSAELWVQPNGFPSDWSVPIEQGAYNGGNPEGWNIYVSGNGDGNGNTSYFYLDMRPGLFQGFADFPISFGNWYHLVLTYDGANAMFYINGVAHGPYALGNAGFIPYTGDGAHVGSGQDIGWLPFIGGVDEVAFYQTALTATQVTNHYAVGLVSFAPASVPAGFETPPSPETAFSGVPVTFNVTASGTPPFTYTWTTNGVVTGGDTNFLTFTPQYPGDTNDQIVVVVKNPFGAAVTSAPVALTVENNLNIISPPGSITRNVGSHAAFHVTANGAVPILYQWSVSSNGGPYTVISSASNPTATNETLWLSNVQLSQNNNNYSVLVTNPFFNSTQSATLNVQTRTDPPVSLTGYGAIIAADNPVAYWRLDETSGTLAEDAVGTFDGAYTPGGGTVTYGVTPGIPNSTDTAVTLAGGATIQVDWAPELNPDTVWSVETWLNPSSLSANGGDYRVVLSSQYNLYPNAYNGWYIYQEPGNLFAFVPQPGNGFITAGPNDPAHGNQLVAGNWYHLVVTDDTTNFNVYINGDLITTYPVASSDFVPNGDGINADGSVATPSGDDGFPDDGANFVIGQRTDAQFNTFLGSVDDTAIYQYALTPHQIALHYADSPLFTIAKSGANVVLTWSAGVLQSATTANGTYANVPGATSPYTTAASLAATYYRVHVP
jgi:hypothetical protein